MHIKLILFFLLGFSISLNALSSYDLYKNKKLNKENKIKDKFKLKDYKKKVFVDIEKQWQKADFVKKSRISSTRSCVEKADTIKKVDNCLYNVEMKGLRKSFNLKY